MSETDGIRTRLDGTLGRIRLDRPKALNALTLPMVRRLEEVLAEWRKRDLTAVLIDSTDARAFCAGGDIRAIRENTLAARYAESEEFFATEYRVNATLAAYPHPVVALIDGVCMGGGLGLSVHGPFRVVTDAAVFAMPETGIGFFPDIGASHFLPRLPGAIGMYLGLTGHRVGAAEALEVGLATHYSPAEKAGQIPELLRERGERSVDEVLRQVAGAPDRPSELAAHRGEIDHCFGAASLAEIRGRLAASATPWARDTLATVDRMSPASLAVTFDLLTRGRERSLAECLDAELRAGRVVTRSADFVEGVRAVLVDKDKSPRWASEYTSDKGVRG
ncbi:enoyl-CoA hydratase/isomerase family protein [Amycolatopsis taiwanensis]|uniref:enoyl-CoA hydratase/isomerase family protein n=1 Tax=Amycolatopsis taiwanensis TaxID=342230 RepID=UPI0004B68A6D|nr:enoyl-CoA hydratase/isomerase family protein [Amycolatopsis taiwanensis]